MLLRLHSVLQCRFVILDPFYSILLQTCSHDVLLFTFVCLVFRFIVFFLYFAFSFSHLSPFGSTLLLDCRVLLHSVYLAQLLSCAHICVLQDISPPFYIYHSCFIPIFHKHIGMAGTAGLLCKFLIKAVKLRCAEKYNVLLTSELCCFIYLFVVLDRF